MDKVLNQTINITFNEAINIKIYFKNIGKTKII